MKKALVLIAVLAFMTAGAFADNCPLITVDENGHGTLNFTACVGGITALHGVLQNDPGPGGLANVLTYNLLGPPSLTSGDLRLYDSNGIFSDVVRFNDYNTGGEAGYPASLLFYSDPVGGIFDSLADIYSPPTAYYANVLNLTEMGAGFVLYTPAAGNPGYVPGFSVTYDIISDTPEPSTLLLLGSGIAGLAAALKRRLA